MEKIDQVVETYIPQTRQSNKRRKLWMTNETDAAVAKKHMLRNKYQKTMSKEDDEKAQEANQEWQFGSFLIFPQEVI